MELNTIYCNDALQGLMTLPDACIQTCTTSPPYYKLRDYGIEGQYGLEDTPELYVNNLVAVFNEVKRVLKPDGTLWLNLGDAYWGSGKAGKKTAYKARHKEFGKPSTRPVQFGPPTTGKHEEIKPKDLIGIPWMVAFGLRKAGWFLRQDIIWYKPNAMPESTTDRCTKSHEYIFLLSKSGKYFFDRKAVREAAAYDGRKDILSKGSPKYRAANVGSLSRPHLRWQQDENGNFLKNKRSVWIIPLKPFMGAHFASFPEAVPSVCIRAGSKEGDVVLDPFMGAGTTALAAKSLNRNFIGIELNPDYITIAKKRLLDRFGIFNHYNS